MRGDIETLTRMLEETGYEVKADLDNPTTLLQIEQFGEGSSCSQITFRFDGEDLADVSSEMVVRSFAVKDLK